MKYYLQDHVFPDIIIEKEVLKKFNFSIQHRVDTTRFKTSNLSEDAHIDMVSKNLLLSLNAHVFGQELDDKIIELDVPVDWFESFKERWFPKFLLKKYPLKMKKVSVSRKLIWEGFDTPEGVDYKIIKFCEVNNGDQSLAFEDSDLLSKE